jgi:WD40 repeat protein
LPWPHDRIGGINISGDGRRLAVGGDFDAATTIWDIQTRKEVTTLPDERGRRSNVVALNSDGTQIALFGWQTFELFDVKTGATLASASKLPYPYGNYTVSADLKWLACPHGQDIDLWDIAAAKEAKILSEHRGNVKRVAFSGDGRTLVSSSVWMKGYFEWNGQVKIWDVPAGKERATLATPVHYVVDIGISPDERTLALLDWPEIEAKSDVLLADMRTGQEIFRLKVESVRFASPVFIDNNHVRLLGIENEKIIHIWEIAR